MRVTKMAGLTMLLIGMFLSFQGCDETPTELVTVSGVVLNIDTSTPAEAVVIFLMGAEDTYFSTKTGADGLFTLDVPKGSANVLVANDGAFWDDDQPAGADNDWLTFINWDPVIPTFDADTELVIHDCPTAGSPHTWNDGGAGLGSAAMWKKYVEDNAALEANIASATMFTTGKIVVTIQIGDPPNEGLGFPVEQLAGVTMAVTTADALAELCYWDIFNAFAFDVPGLEGFPVQADSAEGFALGGTSDFCNGAAATGQGGTTDGLSIATFFLNDSFAGDAVTVTLTDADAPRSFDFSSVSPTIVPVHAGATTMLAMGYDGATLTSLGDGMCAAGMALPFCP